LRQNTAKLEAITQELNSLIKELGEQRDAKSRLETEARELHGQNKVIVVKARQNRSNAIVNEDRKQLFDMTQAYNLSIHKAAYHLDEASRERIKHTRENDILKEKLGVVVGLVEPREAKYQQLLRAQEAELSALKIEVGKKETDPVFMRERKMKDLLTENKRKFEKYRESLVHNNQEYAALSQDKTTLEASIRQLETRHEEHLHKRDETAEMLTNYQGQSRSMEEQLNAIESQKETLNKLRISLEAKLAKPS
jgi:hypothetical protein